MKQPGIEAVLLREVGIADSDLTHIATKLAPRLQDSSPGSSAQGLNLKCGLDSVLCECNTLEGERSCSRDGGHGNLENTVPLREEQRRKRWGRSQ